MAILPPFLSPPPACSPSPSLWCTALLLIAAAAAAAMNLQAQVISSQAPARIKTAESNLLVMRKSKAHASHGRDHNIPYGS